jgi:hypothetical protein
MKIVGTSSSGRSKESVFYSNLVKVKVEVVETHLKVDTKVRMVDVINTMVSFMEVDEKILEEGEVMESMVNVIEVNNQTTIQTTTNVGNLGTW